MLVGGKGRKWKRCSGGQRKGTENVKRRKGDMEDKGHNEEEFGIHKH